MAVPSDYAEARDPRTPGARLGELARDHPELQPLIALNPGCPPELHEEIVRTNPSAQRVLEERRAREEPHRDWVQDASATGQQTAAMEPATGAMPGAAPAGAGTSVGSGSALPGSASHGGPIPVGRGAPEPATGGSPLPPDLFEPADQTPPRRERRTAVWALVGCLVLLVPLVLVGFFAGRSLMGGLGGGEDPSAAPSRTSSSPSSEQPSEESSTSSPSQKDASPAPKDAVEMTALASPSGNIACTLDGDQVGCSLTERTFGGGVEDCPAGQPFSVRAGRDGTELACGTTFGEQGAKTLDYGGSAKNGNVACTSESDGMTCWDVRSGHGFTVSKAGYETF